MQALLAELLKRHKISGIVHLNDIAEVINARAVSYDEVEFLITGLEAEGLHVGEPLGHHDVGVMRAVLDSARRLRAELRRAPTIDEIASDSGLPAHAVRRSLEHGKSAARA